MESHDERGHDSLAPLLDDLEAGMQPDFLFVFTKAFGPQLTITI